MTQRGHLRPLSAAPMLDWTDRHFRFFLRQITRETLLYTEMVTTSAILRGDRNYLLAFDPEEHPVALQLGGDDPLDLAECARIAEQYDYDELNLNAGCPSERVRKGNFGVCLMERPETVARCVEAMRRACAMPVTVKHRIGVEGRDDFKDLLRFVDIVASAGADRFIVHARSACPNLTPEQNRKVPSLRRDYVHRLKEERPSLRIELNGDIRNLDEAQALRRSLDGTMIGRRAYVQPWLFVEAMVEYADRHMDRGRPLHDVTRHMLGLLAGEPGARAWRRRLSEISRNKAARPEVLRHIYEQMHENVNAR